MRWHADIFLKQESSLLISRVVDGTNQSEHNEQSNAEEQSSNIVLLAHAIVVATTLLQQQLHIAQPTPTLNH